MQPVTSESVHFPSLLPVENMCLSVARRQAGDGESVPPNTAMMLIQAIDRLTGIADWTDDG